MSQIHKEVKRPLKGALFLLVLLLGPLDYQASRSPVPLEKGILGGPTSATTDFNPASRLVSLSDQPPTTTGGSDPVPLVALAEFSSASLKDPAPLVGTGGPSFSGVLAYTVQGGDSLSKIASRNRISIQLLRSMNPGLTSKLRVGSQIVLVGAGGAPPPSETSSIEEPSTMAIRLPMVRGYFIMPTKGFNWGILHPHNAVDIANNCGTFVVAAAEGVVVPDVVLGGGSTGWNGGYGTFVLVEHPNGTKTRYAHLGETVVSIGDYVKQGQEIGVMGNTGNTHGPTGCHLHFEIIGAKNPFTKS